MVDARAQALNFQMTQIQNAQIGRTGAVPALASQPQSMGGAFAARGSTATPAGAQAA
jgi:hypothetical protein